MTDSQDREFEELVVRYQGVVCAVAYSVLRDRARSEEVAQEAFLVAWQKLPAMSVPPRLPGWICGIAKNLAANAARRRKETAMEIQTASDTKSALDNMLDRETEEQARAALASLREADREVVVLYYRGDGSIADVATTLGITESAAKQRLHRGRERLRAALSSVETTLRQTRPGTAFTAACLAAYFARASHASAATATVATSGKLGVIAATIASGVFLATAAFVPVLSVPLASASTPETSDAVAVETAHIEKTSSRAALVERIAMARSSRLARKAAAPGATATATADDKTKIYDFAGSALDDLTITPPADLTTLNKATMRYAIRSLQPYLLECYGSAYDSLSRKDGTLTPVVTLVGEPDVGSVVESVELQGDDQFTTNAVLTECVRETLMTVELPPLEAGGRVQIYYPFAISGRRP